MNYIKHLSAFFERVFFDDRLNPSHVSLYIALFQFWNTNRFENPLSINRNQLMQLSKIGSEHTYYRDLYDLHDWGYIQYFPSRNPVKGSLVNICTIDTSSAEVPPETYAKSTQAVQFSDCKNDTSTAQALHPSLNYINITNNKTIDRNKKIQNVNSLNMKTQNADSNSSFNPQRKKVAAKKERVEIPPYLEQVKAFFKLQEYPELEAQKFFNHFQSNGWKVGGKSPMKDWQAAARNWILNFNKFNPPKVNSIILNKNKNYGEPL